MTRSTANRLLDVDRRAAWTGNVLPVLFADENCPHGHGPMTIITAGQLPLFRSHGHGAVRRTRWRMCPACHWAIEFDTTEVNPRKAIA